MKNKIPDNVVYNEKKEHYDASLKPYGTNVGAPSIELPRAMNWKGQQIHKANQVIESRFESIKNSYNLLLTQIEINELIYNAHYNFEPIIGNSYHLYYTKDQQAFLSIIPPNECNFEFIGSFKLNFDGLWESLKNVSVIDSL